MDIDLRGREEMILSRYITAIAYVDTDRVVSLLVRRRLGLSSRPMLYALSEKNLGQADIVLALLQINTRGSRRMAERIVGRPILVCRSQWLRWPVNGLPRVRSPRITSVAPNPRKPNTPAYFRYDTFKVGRSVDDARVRGATVRDIRHARQRGWIMEEHV